ncbi:MAG TPA: ATP-dependent DNA helicase [Acidimicrobiales bacterium]|nr:ATP-dependent DNA helicase [Acidimicrobiales bacterium]
MPTDAQIVSALERVTSALPGGGETRPGQIEMALAVANAIRLDRHLIVQAGTGTGKSLGYLVPAILLGGKLVVATATKALQDQLAQRDLPFLAERLPVPFTWAVLKGRSNYLCRQRAEEATGAPEELGLEGGGEPTGPLGRQVRRLVEWGQTTHSGDRAELDFEPRPAAWQAVSVSSQECPGAPRCPHGQDCLAEAARVRAAAADVVVVNTHLYGAHLASGGAVLPDHDLVVFDEAHELEDVMADSLGLEIGPGRLLAVVRGARSLLPPSGQAPVDQLGESADRLQRALEPLDGRRLPAPLPEELGGVLTGLENRLGALMNAVRARPDDPPSKLRILQSTTHLLDDLLELARLDETRVAWVEAADRTPVLRMAPVEVGPLLTDRLWGDVTGVLTSATIPPLLARRVGLPEGGFDQRDVGSPFPFERHALLYCAAHLPDPRSPEYEAALHEELAALITAAGGRTLALFTSWRAMHAAADALRERVPGRLYTQADLPKPALVAAFTAAEDSSLFATMGFFQGVDVPGRTLSLVTIDRIPFPRPDEPLNQARREQAGPDAFRVVDLPRAATLLAQGSGRLLRAGSDRGVVAVFDPRLARATYRWDLVHALPPMRRTRHRAEAEAFLREVTQ